MSRLLMWIWFVLGIGLSVATATAQPRRLYAFPLQGAQGTVPTHIVGERHGVVLVWQQQSRDLTRYRLRVLDSTMTARWEGEFSITRAYELVLSDEQPDRQGAWLIFRGLEDDRQLACLYVPYSGGQTDFIRGRVPISFDLQDMVATQTGGYLWGMHQGRHSMIHVSWEGGAWQATIVPFVSQRETVVAGTRLLEDRLTFEVATTQKRRGHKVTTLRRYQEGAPVGDPYQLPMPRDRDISRVFITPGAAGQLNTRGTWCLSDVDLPQGPFSQINGQVTAPRFIDSARYRQYLRPRLQARLERASRRRRPPTLHHRFMTHELIPLATGERIMVMERYQLRSRPTPMPMMGFIGPQPMGQIQEVVKEYAVLTRFDAQGQIERVVSVPMTLVGRLDLIREVYTLDGRMAYLIDRGVPRFYDADTQSGWQAIPPRDLGLGQSDELQLQGMLQEGPILMYYGVGTQLEASGRSSYWFIGRLDGMAYQ